MNAESPSPRSRPGMGRRVGLGLTAALHAVLAGLSGLALRGLPKVDGIPVLGGGHTGVVTREHLVKALELLGQVAPSRRERLRRHVIGIFLTAAPHMHGHYSRITGTCTLDLDLLGRETIVETAGLLTRCATEAWLWHAGRGRLPEDEERLFALSDRARAHFLQQVRGS
jgi:hypothetical protein